MVSGEEHSSMLRKFKGMEVCLISRDSQCHGDHKNLGAGRISEPSMTAEGPHECNWDMLAEVKLGKSFIHHFTGLADD